MRKLRIFKIEDVIKNPEEFNKFINESEVPDSGVIIKENFVSVQYYDKSMGLTKEDHAKELTVRITGHQSNIRDWELDLRYWNQFTTGNDKRPEGERMEPSTSEANNNAKKLEKRIESEKNRMEILKQLLAEVQSGEFVI